MLKAAMITALLLLPMTALATPKELKCETGPITKTYGKTQWLVYSCDDGKSLVIVAAPDNPASPFFFQLNPSESGYKIYGEGTGDKAASDAANDDLKKLSSADVAALIGETKSQK